MNLPAIPSPGAGPPVPRSPLPSDLVAAFLSGRKATTLRSYRADLRDLAAFLGQPTEDAAVSLIMAMDGPTALMAALGWRDRLLSRQLAPATVNRRLAALRSLCQLGRRLALVGWDLEGLENVPAAAYRETAGPGLEGWRRLLARAELEASGPSAWLGLRNRAIVRLLHDLALRRGEVVALDLDSLELQDGAGSGSGSVAVVGKGRLEASRITLSDPARAALTAWIPARADWLGPDRAEGWRPLFLSDPGPGRLTGEGVRRMLRELSRRAGLGKPVRPHGLRHQAITRALDLTSGDVRKVQRFSRHAKVETLLRYDDNRKDEAGELARRLGADS